VREGEIKKNPKTQEKRNINFRSRRRRDDKGKKNNKTKGKKEQHNNMSINNWNQGLFSTSIFGYQIFGKLFPPKKLTKFISPIKTKNGNFFGGLNWEFKVE
jgi:hypothetical protein